MIGRFLQILAATQRTISSCCCWKNQSKRRASFCRVKQVALVGGRLVREECQTCTIGVEWRQTCMTCRALNLCSRSPNSNNNEYDDTFFHGSDVAGLRTTSKHLCELVFRDTSRGHFATWNSVARCFCAPLREDFIQSLASLSPSFIPVPAISRPDQCLASRKALVSL